MSLDLYFLSKLRLLLALKQTINTVNWKYRVYTVQVVFTYCADYALET
ncbi:MAG: hypothetical protein MI810_07520 [Flavobacteriales bacterium]|nr:hypothetical protein [Flavobacteriales bacterium]